MAQFDVHVRRSRGRGLLVDIQNDFLADLDNRLVIPLMAPADINVAAARLNPIFTIEGAPRVLMTQFATSVPLVRLGERIASLAEPRDQIIAAIDFLITGV